MNDKNSDLVARIEVDSSLLSVARRLLEEAGFTVAEGFLSPARFPWILAENGLFALGVVAGRRLEDVVALESFAASTIADRIRGAGPKRWDAYVVMLARGSSDARGSHVVRDLQHDTRLLRRVVNLGVRSDDESVRHTLRPFLPLPVPTQEWTGTPDSDLENELVLQGIDPVLAREALLTFQGIGVS